MKSIDAFGPLLMLDPRLRHGPRGPCSHGDDGDKIMTLACGIDFGTSNSGVGHASAGAARLLALQDGLTSVPTALFFSFEDDSRTHGRVAMQRYLSQEPGRLMRSIKSLLGTALWAETTQVKHRRYAFADIVADFVRFLRVSAAAELGAEPDGRRHGPPGVLRR